MNRLAQICGIVFGAMMLGLAAAITAETILRKFFAFSLGGIDELSGYAVAIASPLAFTVALIQGGHIRINQLTVKLPKTVQAVLDVISALSMAALGGYFLYFTIGTVIETNTYRSIAQTPWATPLIYPQSIWLVAMAIFAIATLVLAARSVRLLVRRDWKGIAAEFGAASEQKELEEELADLRKREELVQ